MSCCSVDHVHLLRPLSQDFNPIRHAALVHTTPRSFRLLSVLCLRWRHLLDSLVQPAQFTP